jgi:outer membrane protein assembly factor BamB
VIYLDEKGRLVKLDLHTGQELARVPFSTSAAHSEPLLVDGVLVLTDYACHMAGYDPATLERLWVNRLRGACRWRPAVHKGYLLTQTTEGGLAATVARTGEKVWEAKHRWRWSASPMGVSSTHAAILSLDGRLTCHRLEI